MIKKDEFFQSKRIRKDITGKKFGDLIVKEYFGTKSTNHLTHWTCECICGQMVVRDIGNLMAGRYKSCGCRLRAVGKNCPRWTGYEEIPGALWGNMIRNAEKAHRKFEITQEYIWSIFLSQNRKCALTGVEISFSKPCNASLDRIDSGLGYIVGNVQWVDKSINALKSNFDQQKFIEMCRLVSGYNK